MTSNVAHPDTLGAAGPTPRKNDGPVCEVCKSVADVLYRCYPDDAAGRSRYFCFSHSGDVVQVDGPFHERLVIRHPFEICEGTIAVTGLVATWDASATQVEHRDRVVRANLAAWRAVIFDWSRGQDVDRGTLRVGAEAGWLELQDLLRANNPLEGNAFWQCRHEAVWLRSAMIHSYKGNQGDAKRRQLELVPEPLTFCAGTSKAWRAARKSLYPEKVCGRVFPDTLHDRGGGGSYWLHYCPEHDPQNVTASKRP